MVGRVLCLGDTVVEFDTDLENKVVEVGRRIIVYNGGEKLRADGWSWRGSLRICGVSWPDVTTT